MIQRVRGPIDVKSRDPDLGPEFFVWTTVFHSADDVQSAGLFKPADFGVTELRG
jgi:hypothetical protein